VRRERPVESGTGMIGAGRRKASAGVVGRRGIVPAAAAKPATLARAAVPGTLAGCGPLLARTIPN